MNLNQLLELWAQFELTPAASALLHLSVSLLAGLAALGPARWLAARLQQRSGRTRRDVGDFIASYAAQARSGPQALARVDTNAAIRASLNLPPWMHLTHIRLAGAVAMCLSGLGLGLPAPLAGVAAALGWFVTDHALRLRWQRYCQRIDQALPVALARLGPDLAGQVVLQHALAALVRHDPEAPLSRYLTALLARVQDVGADTALREAMLMADSISETLQTVVFLLGRVQATGGAAYKDTIESTADRLITLEQARADVRSQTRSATVTILIVVLILFGSLGFLVHGSPALADSFRTPAGLAMSALAGGWMMLGYVVMAKFVHTAGSQ